MDSAPLTLNVLHISPQTLLPSPPPLSAPSLPPKSLPPPPPPPGFTFSPTPNYPSPFGTVSLGTSLQLRLALENTHVQRHAVLGVKMMVEVQGPGGRYRLGEVIHQNTKSAGADGEAGNGDGGEGEELPELGYGESVGLEVEAEMKDLGLNVVICSVAWETLDGRRTFQRFFKFNVTTPLGIKTRIQTPSHPNTTLDPHLRQQIYLEVFMQNTSSEGMRIGEVGLEPVDGLESRAVGEQGERAKGRGEETLVPGDTRQYLFVLSPSAPAGAKGKTSAFPPVYAPGQILPLGRLEVAWISGVYHTPGKLQTSMLNRRAPIPPAPAPTPASGQRGSGLAPTRTTSAAPPTPSKAPSNPSAAGAGVLASPSPRAGSLVPAGGEEDERKKWEFDLTMQGERLAVAERDFTLTLALAVRGGAVSAGAPPAAPRLAVQYLTPLPPTPPPTTQPGAAPNSQLAISPPSRTSTPHSPAPSISSAATGTTTAPTGAASRPFSPLTPSRPMTPLSSQLRQAVGSQIGFSTGGGAGSAPATPVGLGFAHPSLQPVSTPGPASASAYALGPDGQGPKDFPPVPTIVHSHPGPGQGQGQGGKPQVARAGLAAGTAASVAAGAGAGYPAQVTTVHHLGNSLYLLPPSSLVATPENFGPGSSPPADAPAEDGGAESSKPPKRERWEAVHTFEWKFVAFEEGLGGLGGVRVLVLDDEEEEGAGRGVVGREWESLGDVLIVGE
ncbi:hypothetical protein IAT38_004310 [Cryptococcus sp. DSM 104549]